VVDRVRQVLEESLQRGRIGRIEGGGAPRADVERYTLEALGIATCEHDLGTLGASTSGCGEPYAGAAADHDTVCPRSSGSR
jgi:hypothetical protein